MRVFLPRLAALVLLAWVPSSPAAEAEPDAGSQFDGVGAWNHERLGTAQLAHLPFFESLHQAIASGLATAVFGLEESGGFTDLDVPRVTLTGNSALWTKWRLGELDLTDPAVDGAEAVHVPYALVSSLETVPLESARHPEGGALRLELDPARTPGRMGASFSLTNGGVGGITPGAIPLYQFFSGAHALQAQVAPDPIREHVVGRLRLSAWNQEPLEHGLQLRTAAELLGEQRTRLSFASADGRADGEAYLEHGTRFSGLAELTPTDRHWQGLLLGEFLQRDAAGAEQGFSRPETTRLTSAALVLGLTTPHWHLGLTWKRTTTTPTTPNFTRELFDVDGLGRFPFAPTGVMDAARLEAAGQWDGAFVSTSTRVLGWTPDGEASHPLTYLGAPMGVMDVRSRPTVTFIGEHRAGWARRFDWPRVALALEGSALVSHANARGLALVTPGVGVKADLLLKLLPQLEPTLSVASVPVGVTSQLALLLTPGALDATQFGAQGQLVQRFAGAAVATPTLLSAARSTSVAIGARSALGDWRLSLNAVAKLWSGLPRLVLDGSASSYGGMTDGAFFFDGTPTRYRLVTTPVEQTPIGGTVQAQVTRIFDGLGFFNVGFTAESMVGYPPPGNGPFGNDVGLVDFSQANPNSARNGFAIIDGDRGFVLRVAGGRRLFQRLWVAATVAFRDGQPFGYYGYATDGGQVQSFFAGERGSPLKYFYPLNGTRSAFEVNIDAQVAYELPLGQGWSLTLKLAAANLFDLGAAVVERQSGTTGGYGRSALTLQLPRSLTFAVELLEPR